MRLDLVVTHEQSRNIVGLDVTVAFENTFEEVEKAILEQILKYQPLTDSMRRRGYTVHVDRYVIDALGAWHTWKDRLLALLRFSSGFVGLMRQLLVSKPINWSRDIYVEHVTGARHRLPDAVDFHSENAAVREDPITSENNDV